MTTSYRAFLSTKVPDHQMIAACLTTRNERIDAETETLIPFVNNGGAGAGTLGTSKPGVPTVSGSNGNGNAGNVAGGVRRLMPIECERLQGFPDGWTEFGAGGKPQADAARYRQIGNAVAVPVVEWILRRLVAADAALRGEAASEVVA